MIIDQLSLDELSATARSSPRLRINYDLRDSKEDESQRMLNAIEPGTVIPIHWHTGTLAHPKILLSCEEKWKRYSMMTKGMKQVAGVLCPGVTHLLFTFPWDNIIRVRA